MTVTVTENDVWSSSATCRSIRGQSTSDDMASPFKQHHHQLPSGPNDASCISEEEGLEEEEEEEGRGKNENVHQGESSDDDEADRDGSLAGTPSKRPSNNTESPPGGVRAVCTSWRFLVLILGLLLGVFFLRTYGDPAILRLSGDRLSSDPWDMEAPGWTFLDMWWAALALEYIGPPLFFITHSILDPICVLAGLDVLFLSISGLLLYRVAKGLRPENTRWKATPLPDGPFRAEDRSIYPRVLVQLPMYNERQVFARGIAAACSLSWPRDRLLVQVLDDSTMDDVSEGMRAAVDEWAARGVNCVYKKRKERKGFKAGNLREGLEEAYARDYEFVVVFDADFEPPTNWLLKTVHYLKEHPSLALVQTRWTFLNSQECDLTRYQEIELKWHFITEQLTGSFYHDFFGFNGTAGVWRLSAILQAGNWSADTTVEDMDMAFCTTMAGWKFLFLPDVTCPSEVPATYEAYRRQQHRWSAGPVDLAKKRIKAIWAAKEMPFWHKLYVLVVFIGVRKMLRSLVIFLSVAVVFPLGLLLPDSLIAFPPYGLIFHVIVYNSSLFLFSPELLLLLPGYALFSNTMALLRLRAIFAGLLDLRSIHEWVVTHKTGVARVAGQLIAFAPSQIQRFGRFIASMAPGQDFGIKRSKSMPPARPFDPFNPSGLPLFWTPRPEGQVSRFYPGGGDQLGSPGGQWFGLSTAITRSASSQTGPVRPFPPGNGHAHGKGKGWVKMLDFDVEKQGLLRDDGLSAEGLQISLHPAAGQMARAKYWRAAGAVHGDLPPPASLPSLDSVSEAGRPAYLTLLTGWNGRLYTPEIILGLLLSASALLTVLYNTEEQFSWLRLLITTWTIFQAGSFLQMGWGYIGTPE
eukprot:TRINITY_DN655_c2_g1_i4.p1 TRINITY_DN655_c2_g1~~TRINITY_DN655_c2_g1_i4.p1  ORF type:complete len:861 (-),score=159.11 TRINITY_DN655_c2_g1_i4:316-2898(-)